MRLMAIGATLSCALALVLLVGCGERSEPVGLLPPDLPATVPGAGNDPFVSEAVPTRVVALDDGIGAIAYELGAPLVGAVTDAVDPEIALVGTAAGTIDVDAVRALEPDLILATRGTDEAVLAALTTDPAAPIYTAPDTTADDLVRASFELAIILGDPVLAREVSTRVQADLAAASSLSEGNDPVRVFVDTGFRIPPDPNSLFVELLERAGGVLVPDDVSRGDPVEAIDLAQAAPEVYLATADSRVSLASLESHDTLGAIPAVLEERVVIIDRELLDVRGPDIITTIEELAEILHSDVP